MHVRAHSTCNQNALSYLYPQDIRLKRRPVDILDPSLQTLQCNKQSVRARLGFRVADSHSAICSEDGGNKEPIATLCDDAGKKLERRRLLAFIPVETATAMSARSPSVRRPCPNAHLDA